MADKKGGRAWRPGLSMAGAAVLSVALGAAAAQPGAEAERAVREYRVGPPAGSPEGAVWVPEEGAFYGASADDGKLYRAALGDRTAAATFLPANTPAGRTEALGVNEEEGLLYVAGGTTGRLYVYDLRTT